jgi:hypothetical protein
MLDLLGIARNDRGYEASKYCTEGWFLDPHDAVKANSQPPTPKFRFWAERRDDMVSLVLGVVKNLFEVML